MIRLNEEEVFIQKEIERIKREVENQSYQSTQLAVNEKGKLVTTVTFSASRKGHRF